MSRPADGESAAAHVASGLADRLACPPVRVDAAAQSLAEGATGVALLHIERARAGLGAWTTAHTWITTAAHTDISAATNASLYYGAPALAYLLHTASPGGGTRYHAARTALDKAVNSLAHRRVDAALARINRGELPRLGEFDLINGLTGIGAHLLHHTPADQALERILSYLVRLTQPQRIDGQTLPGWWASHDPHLGQSAAYPGGHGNLGMAHGISGPLALLALAYRKRITVEGHGEAMERICAWLDRWRQDHPAGPWWPQWVTLDSHRTGHLDQQGPLRPSWCYGTPGLARAQQHAAIALGDTTRKHLAEQALEGCLSDPEQLGRLTDASLCHGWAGLLQTTWRAAAEATNPVLAARLPHLTDSLVRHARMEAAQPAGLLEGAAGIALALHSTAHSSATDPGWDACLLIAS
jgi:class I lanthipeptide synthase